MSPLLRRWLLAGAALVWCWIIAYGLHAMFNHATTSGNVADSPERWPAGTRLLRGGGFTIVMFVHPDCPCAHSSLTELAVVAADAAVTIDVVVTGSHAAGPMWDDAGRIAGASRTLDDGREAARFSAHTSGYTVVYDRAGVRRFAGGITGERGHVGDNVGRDAVQRIVAGLDSAVRAHPVFGCSLGGS
jgi:hypothetical protein